VKLIVAEEAKRVAVVAAFRSLLEFKKPLEERIHHNNDVCSIAREIEAWQRAPGTGDYPLCNECRQIDALENQTAKINRLRRGGFVLTRAFYAACRTLKLRQRRMRRRVKRSVPLRTEPFIQLELIVFQHSD
jgi:hypothetical protein